MAGRPVVGSCPSTNPFKATHSSAPTRMQGDQSGMMFLWSPWPWAHPHATCVIPDNRDDLDGICLKRHTLVFRRSSCTGVPSEPLRLAPCRDCRPSVLPRHDLDHVVGRSGLGSGRNGCALGSADSSGNSGVRGGDDDRRVRVPPERRSAANRARVRIHAAGATGSAGCAGGCQFLRKRHTDRRARGESKPSRTAQRPAGGHPARLGTGAPGSGR